MPAHEAVPPAGTVTFLFTDIEGSSRLWEQQPQQMTAALATHDDILMRSVERHNGFVFKRVGDAFCCAFSLAHDALEAAVDAQRDLQTRSWPSEIHELQVRMAIHTGSAVERGGDYFGPTVNRVARLAAIAHGGQILVSSASASLLADSPGAKRLRRLGPHRLRDLREPETTYQVIEDGLRSDFPPLASLDMRVNNLPSQISTFIGREKELARIRRLLHEGRLTTITGPGGIGKTRLALQVGAEIAEEFNDGVYFIALAPLVKPELVVNAIASTLQIRELSNEPLEKTLLRDIGPKKMLLIFDNSERVREATAALAYALLSNCPNVRCLVTSREPLHIEGERVERLEPLDLPERAATISELERADGPRLFLERARAICGERSFSDGEAARILEICKRLEGIPLAIEIAAARLATMSLPELSERLSSHLFTLFNKDSTASERHRTLRATIEWSFQPLSDCEKEALVGMSVFRGSCTMEAVRSVLEFPAADEAIDSLVDKSLVHLDVRGDGARYQLLDIIREFAANELEVSGQAQRLLRSHFDFFTGIATGQDFATIDENIHNIRSALEWGAQNEIEATAKVVLTLAAYWRKRSEIAEARGWTARILAQIQATLPALRSALLRQAAAFAIMQDSIPEAIACSSASLDLCRSLGDEAGAGEALLALGEAEHRIGRHAAAASHYSEARDLLGRQGRLSQECFCVAMLVMLARQQGNLSEAGALLDEARAKSGELGDPSLSLEVTLQHAWLELSSGNADVARELFEQALERRERDPDDYGACRARLGLATAALKCNRLPEAYALFARALRSGISLGVGLVVINALHGISAVEALSGDAKCAAKYLALADRLFAELGREKQDSMAYEVAASAIGAALSESERAVASALGAKMQIEDAVALLRQNDRRGGVNLSAGL